MQKNKRWILCTGLCLIVMVKFIIRPFVLVPPAFYLYRDVAPNLISAFLIPFGADLFLKKWIPFVDKRSVLLICILGLIVITLNELAQLFPVFGRTFDYFDLIFSLIGVGIGYLVFTRCFMGSTLMDSEAINEQTES